MRNRVQAISNYLSAYKNCIGQNNIEWAKKHESKLDNILDTAPHGSGIDNNITLDKVKSSDAKLVFNIPFHHMDNNGFYCGWRDYKCIVTASLSFGFNVYISGKDKYHIHDYLADIMREWLSDTTCIHSNT